MSFSHVTGNNTKSLLTAKRFFPPMSGIAGRAVSPRGLKPGSPWSLQCANTDQTSFCLTTSSWLLSNHHLGCQNKSPVGTANRAILSSHLVHRIHHRDPRSNSHPSSTHTHLPAKDQRQWDTSGILTQLSREFRVILKHTCHVNHCSQRMKYVRCHSVHLKD